MGNVIPLSVMDEIIKFEEERERRIRVNRFVAIVIFVTFVVVSVLVTIAHMADSQNSTELKSMVIGYCQAKPDIKTCIDQLNELVKD